jgi:Domain of unknown function (DUF4253)
VTLPPGCDVWSSEVDLDRPVYWLSDDPATPGLWSRLRIEHARTGRWPLLLNGSSFDPTWPWEAGETYPDPESDPGAHDPEALLQAWWGQYTSDSGDDGGDPLTPQERFAVTAPYGRDWPGPATPPPRLADPDLNADEYADHLLQRHPAMRLGLVAAVRGADALTVMGWSGAANYCGDTAKISAVLRWWEERFGARLVALSGTATLWLSIASPPVTLDQALPIAAEHFAFCPDNVWQGGEPYTLAGYAETLVGQHCWRFWWD